jgi:hypothetical protein
MNLTIEVTVNALRNGVTYANVFCFRTSAEPTNAQVIDAAQQMYLHVLPVLRRVANTATVFTDAVARNMDPRGTFEYTQPFTSNNVGTLNGNPTSGNVAKAIKWVTDLGGRSGTGHNYLGPFTQADISEDYLNSGVMLLLAAVGNVLAGYTSPAGDTFAVGTRKLGGSTPIVGYILTNLVNDIGRRLIGRGRGD